MRQEKVDPPVGRREQVLKEKEFHISVESLEESEEIAISLQHFAQRTCLASIVEPDALKTQIEPITDMWMKAPGTIDCRLAAYSPTRKYRIGANRTAYTEEGIKFVFRHLRDYPGAVFRASIGVTD